MVDRQMEAGSGGQTDGGRQWWTDRWRQVAGGQTDGGW